MFYSNDIIEDIRSKNDIVDVINGYIHLKQNGSSYTACCPFHSEKTPSFHVNRQKQIFHCFGCNEGGNVYSFVMKYDNVTFPEAIVILAERCGVKLPEDSRTNEDKRADSYKLMLKEMNKEAANYFYYILMMTERGQKGREYISKRGFTEDTIKKFGMGFSDIYRDDLYKYLKSKGYKDEQLRESGLVTINEASGATDKFWNRVMVPILDINGKVIAFGGRVLGDGTPKYLNTQETAVFDKSRTLFAMDKARRSKRMGIILCEGYMDVIAMHQSGFDNAVASLGTAFTLGHATLIKRYSDEVYLAYDSDGAGVKATLKAIGILRQVDITSRVIDMRPYKDPDEFIHNLGPEAFNDRIKAAVTGTEFEIGTIAGTYNLNDPDQMTRFLRDAAARLSTIDDPIERHSYTDAIADKYNVDKSLFKEMVTKYGTMSQIDAKIQKERQLDTEVRRYSPVSNNGRTSYKLLLSWMTSEVELFKKLKGIISAEDFENTIYKDVALRLFEQYEQTGTVNPAAIIDEYQESDDKGIIAEVMQTELPFEVDFDEKERALNDVVKRVKDESISYLLTKNMDNSARIKELVIEKAKLSKLHISLKNG